VNRATAGKFQEPRPTAARTIGGATAEPPTTIPPSRVQSGEAAAPPPVKSLKPSTAAAKPPTTALPAQLPQRAMKRAMNDNDIVRSDIELARQKRAAAAAKA